MELCVLLDSTALVNRHIRQINTFLTFVQAAAPFNTIGFTDLVEAVAHELVNFVGISTLSSNPRMANDCRQGQALGGVVL